MEEERKEEEAQTQEAACCPGKRRDRESGDEGVFNPNNSQPKRLNYP